MADFIKIDFDINTTSIQKTIGEIDKLNKSLESTIKASAAVSKQMASTTSNTVDGIAKITDGIDSMNQSIRDSGKEADELGKKFGGIGNKFDELGEKVKKHKGGKLTFLQGLQGASGIAQEYGVLNDAVGTAIDTISMSRTGLAQVATALGGPVTIGLGAAAAGFAALTYSAAGTFDELKKLESQFSLTSEQADKLFASASGIQAAYGGDISEITSQLNTLQQAYGVTAEEAERSLSIMREKLGEAASDGVEWIQEYAAQQKEMGFSIEETSRLIIASRNAGVYDDKMLDAIHEFRIRINNLTEEQKKLVNSSGNLSDILEKIRTGAISGKEGMELMSDEFKKLQANGQDLTAVLDALYGSSSEATKNQIVNFRELSEEADKLTLKTSALQQSAKDLAESQIAVARELGISAKEAENLFDILGNRVKEIGYNILSTSIQIAKSIKEIFSALANADFSKIWEAVKEGTKAYFTLGQSATDTFNKIISGQKKVASEQPLVTKGFNIQGSNQLKKEQQSPAVIGRTPSIGGGSTGGGGGGGSTPAVQQQRADSEAQKQMSLDRQNDLQNLELSFKKGLHTQAEYNKLKEDIELKYIDKSEELSKQLYSTTPQKWRKRNAEEERDFQLKRDQQLHEGELASLAIIEEAKKREEERRKKKEEEKEKARKAAVEAEKKRFENEVDVLNHGYDLKLTAQKGANERAELNRNTATYDETKTELEKNDKLLALQQEHDAKMLALGEKVGTESRELQQKNAELRLQQEEALANRVAELQKESAERAKEYTDQALGSLGDAFAGVNENLRSVGDSFNLISKFQEANKEIEKLNEELAKVPEGSEAAIELQNAIDDINTDKAVAALESFGQVATAIISTISDFQQKAAEQEIERLDKEIEKQGELAEVLRENYEEDKERVDEKREFEDALEEQRDKELEYLKDQLPEAEAEYLDKQMVNEDKQREANRLAEDKELARQEAIVVQQEAKKQRMEDKKRLIQAKAFEQKRAADITQTAINGAVAFALTLATVPFPLGAIVAPIQAGLAIAQIAQIASQPNPYKQKLAKGTLSVEGGTQGVDSVEALLMPGEAVIPTHLAKKYMPILKDIYFDRLDISKVNNIVSGASGGAMVAMVDNRILESKVDKLISAVEKKKTHMIVDEEGFAIFDGNLAKQRDIKNHKLYR